MSYIGTYSVVGHLISRDGWVWEFLRWIRLTVNGIEVPLDPENQAEFIASLPKDANVDVQAGLGSTVLRNGEQWFCPLSMNPWMISSLVFMINDYKTLVLQRPSLGDRNKVKRHGKKRGYKRLIPPMYYGVMLRDNVVFTRAVQSQFSEEEIRRCYQDFRSDVRGHERCRIRRGLMPLDDMTREKLRARGYTLYEHQMDLHDDDAKRLRERGQPPKQRGEWVAIKTSWVDSYIKGPEDAPYRPAIRHLPLRPPTTWE